MHSSVHELAQLPLEQYGASLGHAVAALHTGQPSPPSSHVTTPSPSHC